MPSFQCFICHNTVHIDTNAETREKYKELVGIKLCLNSHLCHICCHLLRKVWLFKSLCLRRSKEFPVLFSDKGSINLQNSNVEIIIMCPDSEECEQQDTTNHFTSDIHIDTNQCTETVDTLEDSININTNLCTETYETLENNINTDAIEVNINNNAEITEVKTDHNDISDDDNIHDDSEFNDIEVPQNYDTITNETADVELKTNETVDVESKPEEDLSKIVFFKTVLSVAEQKAELEKKRREDKYMTAEFKCYNCAQSFLFKDTYQAHMMRHEESNGEHLCPICLLRFARAHLLRVHRAQHRSRYACARCARAVPPRRRAAHAAACARAPRARCTLCARTYADANALQQHMKRFHLSKTSNKTYSCHVCGKVCKNQAAVRTHMISHINARFPCGQCPASFSSPYTRAQHSKTHGPRRPHQCGPCRLTYSSRKSLLAHLRNAPCHQDTVFICPICSRNCANQRSLDSHIQTVHTTHKPYWCPDCPARYSSKKSLRDHLRRRRGASETRVCHVCGGSFKVGVRRRYSCPVIENMHQNYFTKMGNSKLNRHLRAVCEKNKLEEELSVFYDQEQNIG